MSARSSGAGAFALAAALAAACALVACGDSTRIAAPSARTLAPRVSTAPAPDTTYVPAARIRARLLARALADVAARVQLRDALRRSQLATHRLTMESELAQPRSEALARVLARTGALAIDSLRALFARGPALDLYMPRTDNRRGWRPDRVIAVAVADGRHATPRVVYVASGDSADTAPRDGAYLVLSPAGDRSRRVGAQRDITGDAVEDDDDGTLSGTLTFIGPRGDTTRVAVADLVPNYRTLPLSASPAERERALAELRAARTATSGHSGLRRLIACVDVCGGVINAWRDTTYLVAFYEKGGPETGGDPTYEPWFDGYYRGSRWRAQFDGVPGNAVIFVDLPFMSVRPADHSAAAIKVIGGEDEGWWSDGACTATGMTFAATRYTRDPYTLAVTLARSDVFTWRHCGGSEGDDTWGAMLRWTPRPRPAVAALRVELDTIYMTATAVELPGLQNVPKYKGAYRYALAGCPSVYYVVGTTADGEPLDTTSLSALATVSTSNATVAEPSRPMNGVLRNYTLGSATLTATLDGVSGQGSYSVIPYISAITIAPTPVTVAPGTIVTERLTWVGSLGGRCPLQRSNLPALRPTWSTSSPSLSVATAGTDSSVVWARPNAAGSYTLTAAIGPLRAQATVIGQPPLTTAPVAQGLYSLNGAYVSWTAVAGASGYTVYRRVDGGVWEIYASTTSTSLTDPTPVDYSYAGPSPGTAGTEDFQVAALSAGGTGPISNTVGFALSAVGGGTGGGVGPGSALTSRGLPVVRRIHP